jgi:branched-chain amino acid transport system ATP-binding protein
LGTSRLVEVGRALATAPAVVLLDEPLAGLDAHEAERLAGALHRTVVEEKVSLLLVEHDVGMVLSLCSHIYVLDFGSLIAQGPPAEIRENPQVRAAYLGDEDIAIRSELIPKDPTL